MLEGNGLRTTISGVTATILGALLIGAMSGVLLLWRDVEVMRERERYIIATLERFKAQYDRKELQTDETFSKQFQLIIDLQQRLQRLEPPKSP